MPFKSRIHDLNPLPQLRKSSVSARALNSRSATSSGSSSSLTKSAALDTVTSAISANPDTNRTEETSQPAVDSGASPTNPTVLISDSAHHAPSP